MNERTYYQQNREVMLTKKNCEGEQKEIFLFLSEEEKNIKRKYGRNRYHNLTEEKKQRLKEYQKNYREAKNIFHRCKKPVNSAL